MIPKSGYRFSEKIMPHKTQSEMAIQLKPFRVGSGTTAAFRGSQENGRIVENEALWHFAFATFV
jgi:hypothetical protein